jgi:polysaccharide deacetylase 2 family uncharacterized protein YibQ
MARNGNLTASQTRAIGALMQARTVDGAAKACGVGVRTLHRWLDDNADFRAALASAQSAALDATTRRLAELLGHATSATAKVLAEGTLTEQLRAASLVFDCYAKLKVLGDIEQRIAALEGANDEH